jgi:hypothetical protein
MAFRKQAQPRKAEDTVPSIPAAGAIVTTVATEGTSDVWKRVPGTRFYSLNGEGHYEKLTDRLFVRVDGVFETDGRAAPEDFATAFGRARSNEDVVSNDETSIENEASAILQRIERDLAVEEALTRKLLQRYGIAA